MRILTESFKGTLTFMLQKSIVDVLSMAIFLIVPSQANNNSFGCSVLRLVVVALLVLAIHEIFFGGEADTNTADDRRRQTAQRLVYSTADKLDMDM